MVKELVTPLCLETIPTFTQRSIKRRIKRVFGEKEQGAEGENKRLRN